MNFRELHNGVEHLSAVIRKDLHSEDEFAGILADAILVFGQSFVGIYNELHDLRVAIQDLNSKVIAAQEIGD